MDLAEERRANPTCAEEVSLIRHQVNALVDEINADRIWRDTHERESAVWRDTHERESADLMAMQHEIQSLIDALGWMRTTVRIVKWGGGALLALLLLFNEAIPWLDKINWRK